MMSQDRGRERNGGEGGCTGGGVGMRSFAFESGNVGAIDGESTVSIIDCDWAIENEVVAKDRLESFVVRSTEHTVEFASKVGLGDLAGREHSFMLGYCQKERISRSTFVRIVMCVYV